MIEYNFIWMFFERTWMENTFFCDFSVAEKSKTDLKTELLGCVTADSLHLFPSLPLLSSNLPTLFACFAHQLWAFPMQIKRILEQPQNILLQTLEKPCTSLFALMGTQTLRSLNGKWNHGGKTSHSAAPLSHTLTFCLRRQLLKRW